MMVSDSSSSDKLAALNSAAMGISMPVVALPDGQRVQTGTIGTLIINIKHYDELMSQLKVDNERKVELEDMMAASLPVLKRFSEWCYSLQVSLA